jgi:NADH-quinone oxidoreductase subunit C
VTTAFSAKEITAKIQNKPAGITVLDENTLLAEVLSLKDLLAFLKNTPGLEFDYLADMSATDYWDYFEILYQLVSIKNNHRLNIKTRLNGRGDTVFPSVTDLYKGAELQEREIHDLLGFKFEGHPNLKPIVLWEGFKGYPLRKDYLE